MITLKIKYVVENEESKEKILRYIKNYNSVFNCLLNHFQDQNKVLSTKDSFVFMKSLNNIFVDTTFQNSALYDAKQTFNKFGNKKLIFGGKKLFLNRIKNLISKKEFQLKKLRPLQIIGAACNKGNCKFQILSEKEILFKATRKEHFILDLESIGKNYQNKLKALILAQEKRELPITYKLDLEYVYITFDETKIEKINTKPKLKNRIFAIDMNPNYIGWSVVDWKAENKYSLVKSGVISIKNLNDYESSLNVSSDSPKKKYITNKRKYEIIQIGIELSKLANHFRCEVFGIEDLKIISSDKSKGRNFNRLVNNQWNKTLLVHILEKNCKLYQVHFQKVLANYSSFIGNLVYRNENLPDPCLASIEIGRRTYEFYHQYILKDKNKEKNIIFDKLENVKDRIAESLEEFSYSDTFDSLSDLYYKLKKRKCNYRFLLEDALKVRQKSFSSLKHLKSMCSFIIF